MKIVSWNVNGIRACFKKGLLEFVQKQKPDILCVQELKAFESQCSEILSSLAGYESLFHSAQKPGYSGVGSFVRSTKVVSHQIGMGERSIDDEGRVIVSDLGTARLVNAYFPNGAASPERHAFKMRFLERFLSFLKAMKKEKPVILTGDVNIAHKAIDIHDPVRLDGTSGFMPEEREWMDRLLSEGFVDAYRLKHPKKADQYSWWSYRAGARQRNKGWRIDYFIISEDLIDRVQKIEMHQGQVGSDHCPLSLQIRL